MEEFLFGTDPYENGCFLLAKPYHTKAQSTLLVTDILKPTEGSWNVRNRHSLTPNSSFINECVMRSSATKSGLIFVHTHPSPDHPPTFSRIDRITNRRLFVNLAEIVPGETLGSLVLSRRGMSGVVFDGGRTLRVAGIKIAGSTLAGGAAAGIRTGTPVTAAKFDRQVRALGRQNQQRIQDMVVTVAGVGGTGSSVAVQLARMGVGRIQLIDTDRVDESNLTRIYGSVKADVGKRKVDVLRRHIKSFSKSKVSAICGDVTNDAVRGPLIESDVIFGCTDNHTSRDSLNEISTRFYIPLIDVGCRIDLGKTGAISQAVARVQVVTPGSACLWCTGTLNAETILHESLPKQERRKLVEEGYYGEIDKQPSVISLTTLAASMGVNKFLGMIGSFGDQSNTIIRIELKDGFMIKEAPEIRANCHCRKQAGSAA